MMLPLKEIFISITTVKETLQWKSKGKFENKNNTGK